MLPECLPPSVLWEDPEALVMTLTLTLLNLTSSFASPDSIALLPPTAFYLIAEEENLPTPAGRDLDLNLGVIPDLIPDLRPEASREGSAMPGEGEEDEELVNFNSE